MLTKSCSICLVDFTSAYLHKKTCSERCSKQLQKQCFNKWKIDHGTQWLKLKRENYKRHAEEIIEKQLVKRKTASSRSKRAKYQSDRIKSDPVFKAKRALRHRLYMWKQNNKGKDSASHSKSLGCTWQEFVKHIEKLFYAHPVTGQAMSWLNHGRNGWEFDHKIQLAKANTVKEVEKLCHYVNLQPLWIVDHYKKSKTEIKETSHEAK